MGDRRAFLDGTAKRMHRVWAVEYIPHLPFFVNRSRGPSQLAAKHKETERDSPLNVSLPRRPRRCLTFDETADGYIRGEAAPPWLSEPEAETRTRKRRHSRPKFPPPGPFSLLMRLGDPLVSPSQSSGKVEGRRPSWSLEVCAEGSGPLPFPTSASCICNSDSQL